MPTGRHPANLWAWHLMMRAQKSSGEFARTNGSLVNFPSTNRDFEHAHRPDQGNGISSALPPHEQGGQ